MLGPTWVYDDDDDKDDDYEDDDEDGQVNDDVVEDGEDDGYEDDDEDGQVSVHVTAFGDHAQNTGIYSIFFALCTTCCARMWSKTHCHKHPNTAMLLLPALLRYCLRSTMSLLAPPPFPNPPNPPPPGTLAKRPKTQKNRG